MVGPPSNHYRFAGDTSGASRYALNDDSNRYGGDELLVDDAASSARTGAWWTGGSQAAQQALQLAAQLVLARILTPHEFGLVAEVLSVSSIATVLGETGVTSSLVHRATLRRSDVRASLIVSGGLGLVIAAAVFASAEPIARFFDEPQLTTLTRVIALSYFLSSVQSVPLGLLLRRMALKPIAAAEVGSMLCGALLAIGLTANGVGPIALVLQAVVTTAVRFGVTWIVARPKFTGVHATRSQIVGVTAYAGPLIAFNVLHYGARNLDSVLVGRLLGPAQLAFYGRAYTLMLAPQYLVGRVTSTVVFSSLSRVKDDPSEFRDRYCHSVALITYVVAPTMCLVAAVARPAVRVGFGSEWLPMVPLVQALALAAPIQAVTFSTGAIYQALGRTGRQLRWGLIEFPTTIAGFGVIAFHRSTLTLAITYAVITTCILPIPALRMALQETTITLSDVARAAGLPIVLALASGLAAWLVTLILESGDVVALAVALLTGCATYLTLAWLAKLKGNDEVRRVLREIRRRSNRRSSVA